MSSAASAVEVFFEDRQFDAPVPGIDALRLIVVVMVVVMLITHFPACQLALPQNPRCTLKSVNRTDWGS